MRYCTPAPLHKGAGREQAGPVWSEVGTRRQGVSFWLESVGRKRSAGCGALEDSCNSHREETKQRTESQPSLGGQRMCYS